MRHEKETTNFPRVLTAKKALKVDLTVSIASSGDSKFNTIFMERVFAFGKSDGLERYIKRTTITRSADGFQQNGLTFVKLHTLTK